MYTIHYKDGTTDTIQMSIGEAQNVSMNKSVHMVEVKDDALYIDNKGYYKVKDNIKFYINNK